MNAERLLQHFERISEAPDAIPCLRRFILDLAVRGKLVEQDPNDEPASELLKQIQVWREDAIRHKQIREPRKLLKKIDHDEAPYTLPAGWVWARLGEVIYIQSGDGLTAAKMNPGDVPVFGGNGVNGYHNEHNVDEPTVVIGRVGYYCGSIHVTPDKAWVTDNAFLTRFCHHAITMKFLVLLLNGTNLKESEHATAQPVISGSKIYPIVVGLPPLTEQHRIVANVDEIMALCDQLEAAKTEREQSRDRLVAASLHRLNSPTDTAETDAPALPARQADAFHDHARFVFNHLPRLTTRPEHIKQLRQTILNLAVRGKLVPQEPNDELTAELLSSTGCDEEKSALFSLPDAWKWAKVQEIANTRLGKMLDQAKNKGTERRYLRNVNVRWFDFELSDVLTMRFEDSELEAFSLRVGDVLICEGGEPGRAAVWDGREKNIYFQKAIHRVRFAQGINPHYFVYVLKESADSGRLAGYFTGVGIKHFTAKGLSSFLIPLPPLAEQHRIVARVDELMTLCDQFEVQLTTTEDNNRRLLEAILHEALNPLPDAAT